jgi:dihydroorotate dehydrogenase electron transfer subunit
VSPSRLRTIAVEAVGPYALVRLRRGEVGPGIPGQFFMLRPRGLLLPRPMSLCLAPPGELGFLVDPIGPGTRALAGLEAGEEVDVLGPLGNGFDLDVERPLLVGGGIGVAPFPYLSERLGGPPALLGFRTAHQAEAAALVPNAEVVLEPTYVTEALEPGFDVLACGPEPMLEAVRRAVKNWSKPSRSRVYSLRKQAASGMPCSGGAVRSISQRPKISAQTVPHSVRASSVRGRELFSSLASGGTPFWLGPRRA